LPYFGGLIKKLFNVIVSGGHVPDAFRQGIIILMPKGTKGLNVIRSKTEFYNVKNVELCLFHRLQSYFLYSNKEFRLKRGVGCNDAIYTMRKVVDFFAIIYNFLQNYTISRHF